MKVFAVQLDMRWQDKAANRENIRGLLRTQEIPPGSLIVLPEMCETGFSMQIEVTAQSQARESEAFFQQLAREHACAVLAGVVGPIEEGMASNEAVAFAPDGTILVRYRKMRPFSLSGENVKYRAGEGHQIFTWQQAKIAPFICYDLRFPEVFRPAARDGAECIIVIACWPAIRSEHWVRLLQARAIENQAFVLGVNRCGSEPNLQFDGRSTAFDPHGNQIFEAGPEQQIVPLQVDVEAVRQWLLAFPALRDMRP